MTTPAPSTNKAGAPLSPAQKYQIEGMEAFTGKFDFRFVSATLNGFEIMLKARFADYVKDKVRYEFTRNNKQLLKLTTDLKPPVLFIGLDRISVLRDHVNLRAMSKSGIISYDRTLGNTDTNAGTVREAKLIPIEYSMQLRYLDTDAKRAMMFSSELLTLVSFRALTFNVEYPGFEPFQVPVRSDDLSLNAQGYDQWTDLETDGSENTQSFVFPLKLWGYCGMVKTTPLVNSPAVTTFRRYSDGVIL